MSICLYCGSPETKILHVGKFHPFDNTHGPFNLTDCQRCGSLLTDPMPSKEVLTEYYQRTKNGYPEQLREARDQYPQDLIYKKYVDLVNKFISTVKPSFSWVDIGAGGGEFAQYFKNSHPESTGTCIDFHEKPSKHELAEIHWIQRDLNSDFEMNEKFDVITSFAVLEHVLDPAAFISNIRNLSHTESTIVLVFPRYDSLLSNVLKTKWPFFIPGEHLTVPTEKGLRALFSGKFSVTELSSTTIPYSLKYCLSYLKLNFLNKIIPGDVSLPVPAGLFKVVLKPL